MILGRSGMASVSLDNGVERFMNMLKHTVTNRSKFVSLRDKNEMESWWNIHQYEKR